jgi:hypothetical protein
MIFVLRSKVNTESDFTSVPPETEDKMRNVIKNKKNPAMTIKIAVKFAKTILKNFHLNKLFILYVVQ